MTGPTGTLEALRQATGGHAEPAGDADAVDGVPARFVGSRGMRHVAFGFGDGDFGADNSRARFVGDQAVHGSGERRLPEGKSRRREQQARDMADLHLGVPLSYRARDLKRMGSNI